MDISAIALATKMQVRFGMYNPMSLAYLDQTYRKQNYRAIATELVNEGIVQRVTPSQVKKMYYKMRANYRRIQKKLRANPQVQLTLYQRDILHNMGFLKDHIQYKDGMINV